MSNSKPTPVNELEQIFGLSEGDAKKSASQAPKAEANKPVILDKLISKKNSIEVDEHPDLISPAHAVPSSNTKGTSDDDGTKVILTLYTVQSPIQESGIHPNFIEIAEIESEVDDPYGEHFVRQKNGTTGKQAVPSSTEISELAKRQLQQLDYANPKKGALKSQIAQAMKELKKVPGRTTNIELQK